MLRKLLALFLLVAPAIFAQNSTTVTVNVTDAGGVAWANGTYQINFVGPGTASWPGGAITQSFSGTLNGSGSASVSLPSNAVIIPSPTFWNFKVCPNPVVTVSPSGCFSILNQTISGATQTITATPATISISVPTASSIIAPVTAYADAEISGGWVGFSYYNLTSGQRQCTATPCSSNFSAASGSVSSVFTRTGAVTAATGDYTCIQVTSCQLAGYDVFVASPTACPAGATHCIQLTDDDSTDNCGTSLTNWVGVINASTQTQIVIFFFGGNGAGSGYVFKTCNINLNPAPNGSIQFLTVYANAIFDASTNSGANIIQFGDGTHSNCVFRWEGGTFKAGGASLTVAGMEVKGQVGNIFLNRINWLNFGAGNATLGQCTNYAVQFDNFPFEGTVSYNHWQVNDATTGRCAFNNATSTLGEGTINFTGNVIGGASGSSCASVGIVDGGAYGMMQENNIGNISIGVLLKGNGHRIINNQLDSEGCTANTVNAAIQVSGTVPDVQVIGNTAQFGGGHLTNLIQMVGGSGSSGFQSWNVTHNTQSVTTSTTANVIGGALTACGQRIGSHTGCYQAGNADLIPNQACGTTNTGWQVGSNIGLCGVNTAGANIPTTTIVTQFNGTASDTPRMLVNCQVVLTTAATTSSTLPQCEVNYTEANTSTAETIVITPVWATSTNQCFGAATNTVGNSCSGSVYINPKQNTSITFQTINYASTGATAMVARAYVDAENASAQ